ncbi:MAG: addiction module protein [Nitrosospira sp.]|nr:addiction module protein [Nitrosospira sp.]
MAKAISEIRAEIRELEAQEKRELLGLLVADLEGSENGRLDEIWLKEAQRRFQELKDGSVQGNPASQVFARLERRLG